MPAGRGGDEGPAPHSLQAALIVADKDQLLQISGNGDVLEPHDGIICEQMGGDSCGRLREGWHDPSMGRGWRTACAASFGQCLLVWHAHLAVCLPPGVDGFAAPPWSQPSAAEAPTRWQRPGR